MNRQEWRPELQAKINALRDLGVSTLLELLRRPAISPDFGGEGEYDKAMYLYDLISRWGFDSVEVYWAPDRRAKGGGRPNVVATIKGSSNRRLWIITHLDVVPPGDLSAWKVTAPFEPKVVGSKVYGRGSEDNGQATVSSLMAARALLDLGLRPRRTVSLAFVADEEAGSRYGLQHLLEAHGELFSGYDEALVPDAGSGDGSQVEVTEKSIAWLRLKVRGVQVHASMPHKGVNANRVAVELIRRVDGLLRSKYVERDELFDPPTTTCEPTVYRSSSNSPNIIPGYVELVYDCRVLPRYDVNELIADIAKALEEAYASVAGSRLARPEIEATYILRAGPPTPTDSPIARTLGAALRELRGVEPRFVGIGGGTVASLLRAKGVHAVVWETIDEVAHQPDEYCNVTNMVEDAKVMAYLMLELGP